MIQEGIAVKKMKEKASPQELDENRLAKPKGEVYEALVNELKAVARGELKSCRLISFDGRRWL